jgi:hypothetical protein
MTLKYHISPSGLSENFILRIWEAASDGVGAHVHEETINAPHTLPHTVTVNGLDKVVHIVRLYGAVSATLLHEYNVEPLTDVVTTFTPIQFKIGDGGPNTPAANQAICTTPELIGLAETDFLILRANYGPLFPTTHFTFTSGTGEWELNSPDQFNGEGSGEEFTIIRLPKTVSTVVNDSVVGKLFAGFVDVSADTPYSATHLRKLIRFNGSPVYTFSGSIPIGYIHCFNHMGSTAGTATINFSNGTLLYKGSPKASLSIPRGTEAAFTWDGTNWNAVYINESTWVDGAGTPVAGTILGTGRFLIGDVAAGDPLYTITHNLNISGDYMIVPTIETNNAANYTKNNKMGIAWHHHATDKANKVYVTLQEISGEVQDLYIAWVIIKR